MTTRGPRHLRQTQTPEHALVVRYQARGWDRAPRKARGALERLSIEHEEARATENGPLLLFAPAPIAAVCSVLKGPMLAWTLRQMREDFDFLEALVAVTRIDARRVAIVQFASTQYENRPGKRKKRPSIEEDERVLRSVAREDAHRRGLWCPGCGGARLPPVGPCVMCNWPHERNEEG